MLLPGSARQQAVCLRNCLGLGHPPAIHKHRLQPGAQVTVAEKAWKHQAKKAQLQESPAHVALEALEGKLRAQQAAIFQASEVIKTKESEMNYKRLAATVTALVGDLNTLTIRSLPAAS